MNETITELTIEIIYGEKNISITLENELELEELKKKAFKNLILISLKKILYLLLWMRKEIKIK